ncbi:PrsW family intramembrane metalloprotease [Kitasatospora sp. NBC_01539]|uniref:PrsW family intramembrane metalloprotease n=1 Tax=Kitasatospora sp. NBC_01539 TaxID=2903577 RepID=UPI0038602346
MSRPPSGIPSPGAAAHPAAVPPAGLPARLPARLAALAAGARAGRTRTPPSGALLRALRRVRRHPAASAVPGGLALAGSGALILHLLQRQTGTTGLLVGLGLALLPLPFVLGSVAWLNQAARVPLRHALFCLAWGACTATTVAILANGWAGDYLAAHHGTGRGEAFGAAFVTPLIEELCKGGALLVLLVPVRRRPSCRTDRSCALLATGGAGAVPRPRDGREAPALARLRPHLRPLPYFRPPVRLPPGVPRHARARSSPRTLAAGTVLGAVTACGFAFTENALYLGRAFTDDRRARLDSLGLGEPPTLRDFDTTVHTFVLRVLLSPFAHPLFTALTGLGIAVALTSGRRRLARLAAPAGLAAAVALHGAWNAAAELGTEGFLLVYGLVMVPAFALLVAFAVWAGTRPAGRPVPRARPGGPPSGGPPG